MNFETGNIDYKDSAMGKMEQTYKEQAEKQLAELQKLQQEFDQYRAEEAAYRAAEAARQKVAERRGAIIGAFSTIATGAIVAIFAYFLPSIVSVIGRLFHR